MAALSGEGQVQTDGASAPDATAPAQDAAHLMPSAPPAQHAAGTPALAQGAGTLRRRGSEAAAMLQQLASQASGSSAGGSMAVPHAAPAVLPSAHGAGTAAADPSGGAGDAASRAPAHLPLSWVGRRNLVRQRLRDSLQSASALLDNTTARGVLLAYLHVRESLSGAGNTSGNTTTENRIAEAAPDAAARTGRMYATRGMASDTAPARASMATQTEAASADMHTTAQQSLPEEPAPNVPDEVAAARHAGTGHVMSSQEPRRSARLRRQSTAASSMPHNVSVGAALADSLLDLVHNTQSAGQHHPGPNNDVGDSPDNAVDNSGPAASNAVPGGARFVEPRVTRRRRLRPQPDNGEVLD